MIKKRITDKSERKKNLTVYLILAAAGFLILIPSFGNGFFSDDFSWLLNAKESTGKNFGSLFFMPAPYEYFRPVPVLLFFIAWNVFDGVFIYYRVLILILHIFTVLLLYNILLSTGFSRKVSALSALIFAVMACHSETLYSVYSINEILAAMFVFLGLFVFLSDFKLRGVISILFFLLAVLSRESAFCFIPLIILFNMKSKKGSFIKSIFVILSVTAIYSGLRLISYLNYKQIYDQGNFSVLLLNPFIIIYKIFHFLVNMVFPVKSIFYITGFEFYETLRNVLTHPGQNIFLFTVLLLVTISVVMLILFLLIKINRKIFIFPLFVSLSGVLVYLPFEGTAERFLYLPSAGAALMIGLLCVELLNRKYKLAYILIIFIVFVYSFSVYQRAGSWREASERTVKSVNNINKIIDGNNNIKNVLLTDVPTLINGVFYINQYNFNHIWRYYNYGSEIKFWFYEKPEGISTDLTITYSEFAP